MSRVCTVCQHPNYHNIDVWIIEGVSANEIARRTGLGKHAVRRHRQAGLHLRSPAPLTEEQEATVRQRVDNVVRTRSNRMKERLQDEMQRQAYEEEMKPPLPPEPPRADPPQISRPTDGLYVDDEGRLVVPPGALLMEEDLARIRRQKREWRRGQAEARRQARRQPIDPPSYGL
jgi:hypothetical protein